MTYCNNLENTKDYHVSLSSKIFGKYLICNCQADLRSTRGPAAVDTTRATPATTRAPEEEAADRLTTPGAREAWKCSQQS